MKQPTIEEVAPDKLDLSLAEMRIINPGSVARIQSSMLVQGQLQPLVVRPFKGQYQVIDGIKRVYAAMELKKKHLKCYVLDVDLQQAKLLVLSYNRLHQSMEVWEEAMVLADLIKSHGLDQRSLSKLTGYSRSWVSRRLSLISKIDTHVASEIKMGTINSSQARALIKLPRCKQMAMARVITSLKLPSRQSNTLVKAFLCATDEAQQQYILDCPQEVFASKEPEYRHMPLGADDARLSSYGNELLRSTQFVLTTISDMLANLHSTGANVLKETEKMIINPEITKARGSATELIKAITSLQTPKTVCQNER
ncbi:ParB/RepB/Spo0J family partition protein [Geofilum rubicundum]|uniref:Chromosome (Plasmid) partitioning protein ParB n=1 Tax=Geofilum rubicundum JCM 15548 TaxID=1236989 RepID=A0A0E9LRF3_9BACT|nr:ParB/RepB/Spo0J family partition protein [Geofilum rubicundum]GAO27839.1 chromosome (plasmid) partitioning protein ParB [Geofilum rubicundum JCM 15548]